MTSSLVTRPQPPIAGIPSFVQGHYGVSGNLELVAPAIDGGLWVFWFNGDDTEPAGHRAGAAARCWSGGLHFAGSARVSVVGIGQFAAGPDYLEVTATGDGQTHRYCWTPQSGFTERAGLGAATAASRLLEHDGRAQAVLVQDGRAQHAQAEMAEYPALTWTFSALEQPADAVALELVAGHLTAVLISDERATLRPLDGHTSTEYPGTWQQASVLDDGALIGLDPNGQAQQAYPESVHPLWPDQHWDAVTAAATTLDGGRFDLVARRGEQLWHAWTVDASWTDPVLIEATVWADDPAAPVHRRA